MDERDFFEERMMTKTHEMVCPHCRQTDQYSVQWAVRKKRAQPPRGCDDAALARFAKAQSYMVRRDDVLGCKNPRCRKRFEIEGMQSVAYMQEAATGPIEDREARIRAMFGKRTGNRG